MQIFKAVSQKLEPDFQLLRQMEAFRNMVNDSLRIDLGAQVPRSER